MTYRVAVVGTGAPDQSDSHAMAYRHARGFERLADCEMVACADIVRENAERFAREFAIEESNVYEDYGTMLAEVNPAVVSVCTPPRTHAEIVLSTANTDAVEAIHCEKPMAATFGECREMVDVCNQHGVQLTFNHQRRFAAPYQKAKSILDDGTIGPLQRIELGEDDLYDNGTHLFDMCGFMTDQTPVEWVLCQVDCSEPDTVYGLPQETRAHARWRYESGVDGFASTGHDEMVHCLLRLVGERGVIEVGHEDGPPLRYRVDGRDWQDVDTHKDDIWRAKPRPLDRILERVPIGPDRLVSEPTYVGRAIEDLVQALREGRSPELAAEKALQSTEIIFGCWESARRNGLVEFPLEIDDNPLDDIIDEQSSGHPQNRVDT